MFDIGWGELLVIGVVALIAIGPKELPGVLRTLGQWMGKIRRMASEFQGQFQEAMREAEMADLKKQVDEMTAKATELHQLRSARATCAREIESTQRQIERAIARPAADRRPTPTAGARSRRPPRARAPRRPARERGAAEPTPRTSPRRARAGEPPTPHAARRGGRRHEPRATTRRRSRPPRRR